MQFPQKAPAGDWRRRARRRPSWVPAHSPRDNAPKAELPLRSVRQAHSATRRESGAIRLPAVSDPSEDPAAVLNFATTNRTPRTTIFLPDEKPTSRNCDPQQYFVVQQITGFEMVEINLPDIPAERRLAEFVKEYHRHSVFVEFPHDPIRNPTGGGEIITPRRFGVFRAISSTVAKSVSGCNFKLTRL